ncbi:IS3 family transposase [Streptomyces lavendulocolor]|uniref:IS3 family transposase n=1 Tax=Streptomyces lavendulocolor TaxID=67316 RepID=UPI0033C4563C
MPGSRLAARIRVVHLESDSTYGVPRITAQLRDEGERVNHKRASARDAEHQSGGPAATAQARTTTPDPAAAKAPDPLGRDFTATEMNTRYVGDITYLPIECRRSTPATTRGLAVPRSAPQTEGLRLSARYLLVV